jgi:nicotinamide-nucleotide amidase
MDASSTTHDIHGPNDAELNRLAREVAAAVQLRRMMAVTAESCTGGWIAKVLTDLPGSSAWFDAGVVTYSYEAKQALLGVNPRTLESPARAAARSRNRSAPSGSAGSAVAAIRVRSSFISQATGNRFGVRQLRPRWLACWKC